MACKTNKRKNKLAEKTFKVLVLQCPDCGEEGNYVVLCNHCGATLEYKETKELTIGEIKGMLADEVTFAGDIKKIMADESDDEDFDIPSDSASAVDDSIGIVPPLDDDEMDALFDSDEFEPL